MKWLLLLFIFLITPLHTHAQTLLPTEQLQQEVNNQIHQTVIRGEHIESFTTQITIEQDGTIDVRETIIYDFGELEKHGIFRNIPFTKRGESNERLDLTFSEFNVVDEEGEKYNLKKSTEGEQIVLRIGDPDKIITGKHTYIITYTVSGAIGYFDTQDELYWNVTGTEWDVPIATASSSITLPHAVENPPTQCFTGSFGGIEGECMRYQKDKTVYFVASKYLSQNEGLTVLVGFPKNTVAYLPAEVYVPFFERWYGKIALGAIGIVAFMWYIFLPVYLVIQYFLKGRDPYVGKAVSAWYDPPKTASKRPLTPAETGALVDEKVDRRDIFATIIDLARRNYLTIEEKKKKDFYLHTVNKPKKGDRLLPFEKALFDGIFKGNKEIRLKDTKLYTTIGTVENMLYKDMVKEGFFPKNPQSIRTLYTVLGVFALISLNFVLAFIAFFIGKIMPRKTVLGAEQAQVARGVKNFLTSQKRQIEFQADKQLFFEKLLPYAVAFGVEKIWAKRFEEFNLREPSWYTGYSHSHFNSAYLASSLSDSYKSFSTSSTPPSSSSSGFSGGSSGGGGGGGGGGSW